MKVLIIHAHQEEKSFVTAMMETCSKVLKEKGCQVKVSDLYAMKYINPLGPSDFVTLKDPKYFKPQNEQDEANKANFALFSNETKEEHEKLKWADLLIFTFPLYWFHMPGIMKNWVDRNFSMGFAYGHSKMFDSGPFVGKKAMLVYATGGPLAFHESAGFRKGCQDLMNIGIFKFTGISPLEPYVAYSAAHVDDGQRKKYLEELTTIMKNIEKRAEYK